MSQVDELFKKFNKEYKSEIFTKGIAVNNCSRIPFSSFRAEACLYGGIPRGRIVEFSGAEGSGKTTTALDISGNAQKLFQKEWEDEIEALSSKEKLSKEQTTRLNELRELGPKKVVWIDTENTFDAEWAETLGVNVGQMYFMSPDSQYAEEIFDIVLELIKTGEVGLCVLDSIAMMFSKQEAEKTMEEKTYGGIAMALTRFSKFIEQACAQTNCTFIGINQLRDNLNAGTYGPAYNTPGGRCWKHTCSVRLMFRAGAPFDSKYVDTKKSDPNPFGHKVEISVLKSKISKPNRKNGSYTLTYEEGINPIVDMIDIGIFIDVIHKAGAWFTFIVDKESGEVFCREDPEDGSLNEVKVQGSANLIPFLQREENKDIYELVYNRVKEYVYE